MTEKEIEIEVDIEELDEDLMERFAAGLEAEVNSVFGQLLMQDGRRELICVLLSMSAALAIDLGINDDEFIEYAAAFYEEADLMQQEEEEKDISTLN